jgi:hypothetical protein
MHIFASTSPLVSSPWTRSCGSSPESFDTADAATTGTRAGFAGVGFGTGGGAVGGGTIGADTGAGATGAGAIGVSTTGSS